MMKTLNLTDSEWMDLIDSERPGLPACCANISTLRDDLIGAARQSGHVYIPTSVQKHFDWCFPDHDIPPLMLKVAEQLGFEIKAADHTPEPEVLV